MVDVLLTHSYHLYFDRKQVRKMQPYPPLGTLYAAALLRQRGYSVALFDSMLADPTREFSQTVAETRPRIVAIYEDNFNFLSKMCLSRMRQIAFDMIDTASMGGAKVVVNGSDASDHSADYLPEAQTTFFWAKPNGLCWNLSMRSRDGRALKQGKSRVGIRDRDR